MFIAPQEKVTQQHGFTHMTEYSSPGSFLFFQVCTHTAASLLHCSGSDKIPARLLGLELERAQLEF